MQKDLDENSYEKRIENIEKGKSYLKSNGFFRSKSSLFVDIQKLIYKRQFKKIFIFDQLNLSTSKPSNKRKKDLKKLVEKKNGSIFYNQIIPNDPAEKPTAAKKANSIRYLGAEFINKLI